ncbi:type II secretion system F family protein [Candidatus Kaiserbacteria bacterium]|nr:type II secretion system F family protein [Candidatus Kaiserbacteria bacterium]
MSHFSYTAEKNDGELYKGVAEAADRFELYGIVRNEGGRIISLKEDSVDVPWRWAYWNRRFSSVSEYEKVLFVRNLGSMLNAGLALSRALAVVQRQARNARLITITDELESDVRRGDTLHAAMKKFPDMFSPLVIAMTRSGEEGGNLAQSLAGAADQLERMYLLKKKIRGAMIYPSIILLAIVGIGVFMMTSVVPTLASTFAEMKVPLPASTRAVIAISNFLVAHTVLAIALAVALTSGFIGAMKTARGQRALDYVLLHTPIIGGIVREINAARTARTLASLLSAGVDVLSALEITHEVVQNAYCREVIDESREGVGAGQPLSVAFQRREDLYPAFVGEMMSVGEETGQTAEMLKRLATYYEDEVDRSTKDMSTVIEPFLMVVIGGAVGFFAMAMISPIYSLSDHVG